MSRGLLLSVFSHRSKGSVGIFVPISSCPPRFSGSVWTLSAAMQISKRLAIRSFINIIARQALSFVNNISPAENIFMRFILLIALTSTLASAAEIRVGSAAVVITPQIGTPLAGYYETRISTGVHDDLYAKALVIDCGGSRAAMVCCDLITMPPNIAQEARRLIEKDTGLKPEQVMISATHA